MVRTSKRAHMSRYVYASIDYSIWLFSKGKLQHLPWSSLVNGECVNHAWQEFIFIFMFIPSVKRKKREYSISSVVQLNRTGLNHMLN